MNLNELTHTLLDTIHLSWHEYLVFETSDANPIALTEEQVLSIRNEISNNYLVEGALRSNVGRNIKRLIDIGTYRGLRHKKGLPVNGQNTKNNSRTRKGRKKTVANKKAAI